MYEKYKHIITRNLEFTDIYRLVEPIKILKDGEFLPYFYFIRPTLREYAGLPADHYIKAMVEHGVILSDFTEGGFSVHSTRPSIVPSQFRVSVIESVPGNNGAYAVGPYIAYAKPALYRSELKAEKNRLGRNLLVFPAHSVLGQRQVYDVDAFCRKIEEVSLDYDSVRICLYWKDVLLGTAEIYKKYGFEVVTAGHYYDPMFMPRLRSIIETSTMTMSNELGTHVGYCVFFNKPHFFLKTKVNVEKITLDGDALSERQHNATKSAKNKLNNNNDIKLMSNMFSKNREYITEEQYALLNYYWGFDQLKTPKQLRKMLLEIEGLYHLNENPQYKKFHTLKTQLDEERRYIAEIIPIRGYINYKTRNVLERFKKNF